jgi:hypothetical protein
MNKLPICSKIQSKRIVDDLAFFYVKYRTSVSAWYLGDFFTLWNAYQTGTFHLRNTHSLMALE